MAQQPFDFKPLVEEEEIDFQPIDFQPTTPGGHWETRGLHKMWIPDTPPTNERGTRWIDPTPALNLVEQGARNMRESSLGRAFPTLADIAASMMEFTNRSVIE